MGREIHEVVIFMTENMHINGIDVESGVKRFGGKAERYLKMLRSFALGLEIDDTPMEIAFSEERAKESATKIHTIKGVAGNMGATALYDALVAFEITQRKGRPDPSLYNNIWRCMRETKENILNAVRDESGAGQRPEGGHDELRGLLTKLLSVLEISEPNSCEAAVKALLTKHWGVFSDSELEALNRMVFDYEYDEATDVVNKKLAVVK